MNDVQSSSLVASRTKDRARSRAFVSRTIQVMVVVCGFVFLFTGRATPQSSPSEPYMDPLAGSYDIEAGKNGSSRGVVDIEDINKLLRDRNKSVGESACGSPCDLDKDGKITVNDARMLTLQCTFSGCSTDGIKDFSPGKIEEFLKGKEIRSAGEFMDRLPREFKQHWIMMTRSESLQTGTATHPRILLPSQDSSKVFGLALAKDVDFGQADTNKIEYLRFDGREGIKKFGFHEIDMNVQTVNTPSICIGCHQGRPNWDAYDSWGGMLPFNRDRIYENSEEAKAFKRLLEDLRFDPVIRRLELPKGITREGNGSIRFVFDRRDAGQNTVNVRYKKGTGDLVSFPGPSEPKDGSVPVTQGGRYLRLHHSGKDDARDEGRATALFDNFTKYNAQRVAQELLDYSKKPNNRDIRPIALAIATKECDLTALTSATIRDPFRPIRFTLTRLDTERARARLPKLKADLQAYNLAGPHPFGLIRVNQERGATTNPLDEGTITKEVFRRSQEGFPLDMLTEFMIDREQNPVSGQFDPKPTFEEQSRTIALFRFLLEPLGVNVGNWSMSVLPARSQTYTFGDQFSLYTDEIRSRLEKDVANDGVEVSCPELDQSQ